MNGLPLPDGYTVSTDPALLDIGVIHGFIAGSYWAKGMPRALVGKMIANSLCFGVYHHGAQVGFGRVITDRTTFAYVADVFVLPEHRGKGLATALVQAMRDHPELQGLRRWMLVTADAHDVYRPLGFRSVEHPERHMEIHRPAMYDGDAAAT